MKGSEFVWHDKLVEMVASTCLHEGTIIYSDFRNTLKLCHLKSK